MSNYSGEVSQDLLTDLSLEGDESNQTPLTPDGDDPGGSSDNKANPDGGDPGGSSDNKANPDDVSDCIEGTNF